MDNNYDEQFLIIQATIEDNKQETDEKKMKTDEKLTHITEKLKVSTAFMMNQTKILYFSPAQKDASTTPDPTTMVPANRRDPPLDGGNYTKCFGMWNLKHETITPKFYELLIKI